MGYLHLILSVTVITLSGYNITFTSLNEYFLTLFQRYAWKPIYNICFSCFEKYFLEKHENAKILERC